MATALVTGATAGIGESFTRLLAQQGYDLVLVARDVKRLAERAKFLRGKYKIKVEIIVADLSKNNEIAKISKRLTNPKNPIEILVNNAGFGLNKSFLNSKTSEERALLDVLVTAPMVLSHAVLPFMKARNSGRIINVSSVAGWIAGGTYSAAKSYLTVLTESLHTELRGSNVKVTALCPGFTHTEFHARGKMNMKGLPNWLWLDANRVVSDAWRANTKGKALSIPGVQYKIITFISRFGYRPTIRKMGMNVRRRQR